MQCNNAHPTHNGNRRKEGEGSKNREKKGRRRKQEAAPTEGETHRPSSAAQCKVQRRAMRDPTKTSKALPGSAMQSSTRTRARQKFIEGAAPCSAGLDNNLLKECAQRVLPPLRGKNWFTPELAPTQPPRHRPPPATPAAPPGNAPEPPVAQAAVSRFIPDTGARTPWPGASTEWSRPPLRPPRRNNKLWNPRRSRRHSHRSCLRRTRRTR